MRYAHSKPARPHRGHAPHAAGRWCPMRPLPPSLAAAIYRAAGPIAERGLDQTKSEDIAAAVGVPKATLYYYFISKEEILAHLLAEMLRLVKNAVADAATTPASARDRLTAVVHAQLEVMFQHPSMCRALIGELGRAGRIPEIADGIRAAFHTPVAQLITQGTHDGTIRPGTDPATAASILFGAVTITGLTHLVDQDNTHPSHIADNLLAILLPGLAPPGQA